MTTRSMVACFAVLGLAGMLGTAAAETKAPEKLTFTAKTGKVTFNHAAHVKLAKGDCKCHVKG